MEYLTVNFATNLSSPNLGELPENSFRGMASVFNGNIDSWVPTRLHPGAFSKTLKEKGRGVKILWQHDSSEPIGIPEVLKETSDGLFLEAKISQTSRGKDALQLMRDGVIDALSIGFDVIKEDLEYNPKGLVTMRHIREVRLWEVSAVTWGADSSARITEVHSKPFGVLEQLAVTTFADLPLCERDAPWNSTKQIDLVKTWASAIEKPNTKYRRAFLWYDPQDAENFGAYKLPFAGISDGTLEAFPKGIFAAAAALQGARGGVNIPDKDKEQAKSHLEKYYAKMRREFKDDSIVAPWDGTSMAAIGHYEVEDALFLIGQKMTEGMTLDEAKAAFNLVGVEPPSLLTPVDVEAMLLDAELTLLEFQLQVH